MTCVYKSQQTKMFIQTVLVVSDHRIDPLTVAVLLPYMTEITTTNL